MLPGHPVIGQLFAGHNYAVEIAEQNERLEAKAASIPTGLTQRTVDGIAAAIADGRGHIAAAREFQKTSNFADIRQALGSIDAVLIQIDFLISTDHLVIEGDGNV